MMSLELIKSVNAEKCREARAEALQPFVIESQEQINNFQSFSFPFFGDYRATKYGWKMINNFFVDNSGLGSEGEPALTLKQFLLKLKVGYGYAIIEAGQFQVYVGEFKKQ